MSQQSQEAAEAQAPAAAEPSAAAWQQPMQPLAGLPPLPPVDLGWMGAAAGWQQAASWGYGQAGGWDLSAAASYVQPQADYLAQAQAQAQAVQQAQAGGVIFLCDPRTEEECLHRSLLGLPASQAQIVRSIVPEQSLLFLFNVRTRYLFGIFRAITWPQENIEPTAWGMEAGGGSKYPLQVRIRIENQAVLRLPEERVRPLLEYRGSFNRFDLRISKVQADGLAQLFLRMGEPRGLGMAGGGGSCSSAQALGGGAGTSRPPAERTDRRERNGLIFVCDPTTEEECLSRRLLGLPKSQSTLLSKLRETSLLFLFNVRSRQLIGVLQPDGPAGLDLEPAAWGGGRFPVQVRFTPAQPSGELLMLPETMLADVLRYRSPSTRFDLLLRGKPLDRLVALFAQVGVPYTPDAGGGGGGGVPAPHSPPMPPPPQQQLFGSPSTGAMGGMDGMPPPALPPSEMASPSMLHAGMPPPPPDAYPGGAAQQPPQAGYAPQTAQAAPSAPPSQAGFGATAAPQPPGVQAQGQGAAAAGAEPSGLAPLDAMLGQLSIHPQPHPPAG